MPLDGSGWGSTVATGLPRGYEAYVRVFHPFSPWQWKIETPLPPENRVTWRQLAERAGVKFGPRITWRQLAPVLPLSAEGRPFAVWDGDLELNTAQALFDVLGAGGTGPYYFAFDLPAIVRTDRHEPLLYRAHTLNDRHAICSEVVPWRPRGLGTPTYVWPHDRKWIVWTDIDLTSTYVAAAANVAAGVASHPDLETLPTSLTDRVDDHADEQSD